MFEKVREAYEVVGDPDKRILVSGWFVVFVCLCVCVCLFVCVVVEEKRKKKRKLTSIFLSYFYISLFLFSHYYFFIVNILFVSSHSLPIVYSMILVDWRLSVMRKNRTTLVANKWIPLLHFLVGINNSKEDKQRKERMQE